VPLDQDVNEAISRLHFGATLPFWDAAVVVQARRLAPIEEWVVQRIAAMRRCDEGVGTADDITATKELVDLLISVGKLVKDGSRTPPKIGLTRSLFSWPSARSSPWPIALSAN
jgi:hypothetical protein